MAAGNADVIDKHLREKSIKKLYSPSFDCWRDMSNLAQFQSVFRVSKPENGKNGTTPKVVHRNRIPVSCLTCRSRKLKCDQKHPCSTCTKRGDGDGCTYSQGRQPVRDVQTKTSEAQARLRRLESMVVDLMQMNKEPAGSTTEESSSSSSRDLPVDEHLKGLSVNGSTSQATSSGGHLHKNGVESSYLGATHWATVVENIREIRGVLENDPEFSVQPSQGLSLDNTDIMLDTTSSLDITDAVAALPPRSIVEKVLAKYFDAKHLHMPIIHLAKFTREYEAFWLNPSSTSFLWISMLFSALFIGSKLYQVHDSGELPIIDRPLMFQKAGQALVTGRYHKARPYSVEATLLYGVSKFIENEDTDTDVWMIMGICTRLALRMGYHRDPKHLPGVSVFEGEMRRRTFAILETFDLLFSFQVGLPVIIREGEFDTEIPSNLIDADFGEDTKVLPPSRPPTDPTPMLYFCYKTRIAKVLRHVVQYALSLKAPSYEHVLNLDREVREIHDDCPPSLRYRPIKASFTDTEFEIIKRLNIELLFLKCLCVLHRNYLSFERYNPRYAYSRKTCTNAALGVLSHQVEFYDACQPGGRFHGSQSSPSSIAMHDFLLAAMIICLDLNESHKIAGTSTEVIEDRIRKHDALTRSYEIWHSRKSYSRDSRRASNILAIMLAKLSHPTKSVIIAEASRPCGLVVTAKSQAQNGRKETRGYLSDFGFSNADFNAPTKATPPTEPAANDSDPLESLNKIFTDSAQIDWALVDQYLADRDDMEEFPADIYMQDEEPLLNTAL